MISARYLDNRRLSKQVLELYQIIRTCLKALDLIEGKKGYLNHPIVQHVYHDGKPYIIDTFEMLKAMNIEHMRRGGMRSDAFKQDLSELERLIVHYDKENYFSREPLPPFYCYQDDRVYGEAVYEKYITLLHEKWCNDKISPRCNIKKVL
ncbi:hypothetical protein CD133_03405 [Staphylococcus massiliensis CCUG 55927]|uniref:Pyrimidine dimer DNA glycosylase n=2 Tax=Staphylococcus massiliensis TaxID=555791 RepID=K9ART5_9STAP|nr:hypothetical protein C273_02763 [Staphylococcus massiliensis S46]POA00848.1 hypothetical protein CD133_03405 [Staphylococcus massiliensis CCUG 55927]